MNTAVPRFLQIFLETARDSAHSLEVLLSKAVKIHPRGPKHRCMMCTRISVPPIAPNEDGIKLGGFDTSPVSHPPHLRVHYSTVQEQTHRLCLASNETLLMIVTFTPLPHDRTLSTPISIWRLPSARRAYNSYLHYTMPSLLKMYSSAWITLACLMWLPYTPPLPAPFQNPSTSQRKWQR